PARPSLEFTCQAGRTGAAATWRLGGPARLVPSSFFLTAGFPLLPALHPGMANEQYGPTVARQLQPSGFLALHYGTGTPISIGVGRPAGVRGHPRGFYVFSVMPAV